MSDHVYRVVEIVGTSTTDVTDAINKGIQRANQTLENLDWFEVTQIRGHLADGAVAHFQVTMKVGFSLRE